MSLHWFKCPIPDCDIEINDRIKSGLCYRHEQERMPVRGSDAYEIVKSWQGPLWDAINTYMLACGGSPTDGGGARMGAVSAFNRTLERLMVSNAPDPVPMILHCPECMARHIDVGEFATKPHHTHACQCCGFVWRPAVGPTFGVQFLPGFKNGSEVITKNTVDQWICNLILERDEVIREIRANKKSADKFVGANTKRSILGRIAALQETLKGINERLGI